MRCLLSTWILLLVSLLLACGGGGNQQSNDPPQSPPQSVKGSWEVTLSNVDGAQSTGYIEAVLGQSGNSVSSTYLEYFQISSTSADYSWCDASNAQSLSATINGSKISGTVSTCMGNFTFTGDISGGSIYGAWNGNQFHGSFSGTQVGPLTGTYAGNMTINDVLNYVSVTIAQDSSGTVLVTGTADQAGAVLLSATPVGRTILASGTVGGLQVRFWAIPISQNELVVCDQAGGSALGRLYKQ
jgi:hypothetical protein